MIESNSIYNWWKKQPKWLKYSLWIFIVIAIAIVFLINLFVRNSDLPPIISHSEKRYEEKYKKTQQHDSELDDSIQKEREKRKKIDEKRKGITEERTKVHREIDNARTFDDVDHSLGLSDDD